jgi:peptidoglycan hydrolase-like protein with peptidoglycan-binding domain
MSSMGSASSITKTLRYGAENDSVKTLQTLLSSDPTLNFTGTVSGYFGLKTRAAVETFQVKYGVVAAGAAGYGSVGPKTRAELVTVYGS